MKDLLSYKSGEKLKMLLLLTKICYKSSNNVLFYLKLDSLKCYLLANRKCFKSISLANMAIKFEVEEKIIRKLVSKWIYSREIQGSINEKGFLILAQKKHS